MGSNARVPDHILAAIRDGRILGWTELVPRNENRSRKDRIRRSA